VDVTKYKDKTSKEWMSLSIQTKHQKSGCH